MLRGKKRISIAGIVIAVVAIGFAIYSLAGSIQPTSYSFDDTSLKISTQFGESIDYADMTSVQLQSSMPPNLVKIAGANLGNILKGNFESNGTALKVYVDTSVPPFIYLKTKSELVIFNDQSAAQTQTLYDELQQKITPSSAGG